MPGTSQEHRRLRPVAIGATLVLLSLCAIALWFAVTRIMADRSGAAGRAYRAGQWADAARLARETLAVRQDDLSSLSVLARASARLGRDDPAKAIYERRLPQAQLEPEDHLLLGQIYQRHGRFQAAGEAWKKAIEAPQVTPYQLEELVRCCVQGRHFDEAIIAAQHLSHQTGWESRGLLMLGTIRLELNDIPDAAKLFRAAQNLDPGVIDASHDPTPLRKVIARTYLRMSRPDDARAILQSIPDRSNDAEAAWLVSRAELQKGEKAKALAALKLAGSYRALNPLEAEPGPYVGEGRCEKCHPKIYRDSLANRHSRTYYRGAQLDKLPLPEEPLPDPDDPGVTHTFVRRQGVIHNETRVADQIFETIVEYAFGTMDRYLTMVARDSAGSPRISRLSYYHTPEEAGWCRSVLDGTHPTRERPADFQGETIGVRGGLLKCLYCHVTNPRTGHDAMGPEIADRAIGCERCHGPGGNHIMAVEAGFPDLAIVNPAAASAHAVTAKQCNDCHVLEHRIQDNDPENPGWVRSQGIGWTRSRCNTESGGEFGCVTCHDPHRPAAATSAAEYETKCLNCHSTVRQDGRNATPPRSTPMVNRPSGVACPVNAASGCLSCHMPSVPIDALRVRLTDHHIRVRGRNP